MRTLKIIDLIETSNCPTTASTGLPEAIAVPADLADFYRHYGSAILHPTKACSYTIRSPQRLERSDLAVLGEDLEDPDSAGWYALIDCGEQIISIDLKDGPRFGYCYDSFWDTYPTADDTTLIARSFTELVEKIMASGGKSLFWIPGHG